MGGSQRGFSLLFERVLEDGWKTPQHLEVLLFFFCDETLPDCLFP